MATEYEKQWEFLKRNFEIDNLAHAFLFSGQETESIKHFTEEFIKFINCLTYDVKQKPCNGCHNCRMIEWENFPDLLTVKSSNSESSLKNEKDMMEISIEQIRGAQNFLSYKPYYGDYKAVIVENAERMTTEAQSCFLKTLEEPKGKTIIFLVTSKPDLLLPTIFSRCQQVKFFYNAKCEISPDEEVILQDIKRVMNSELAEKFSYVKKTNLEEGNFSRTLNILQKYFRQMLLAKIGLVDYKEGSYPVEKLKKILRLIEKLSYQANTSNLNQKLALEILLMEV